MGDGQYARYSLGPVFHRHFEVNMHFGKPFLVGIPDSRTNGKDPALVILYRSKPCGIICRLLIKIPRDSCSEILREGILNRVIEMKFLAGGEMRRLTG